METQNFTPAAPWIGNDYNAGFLGYDQDGIIIPGSDFTPGKKVFLIHDSMYSVNSDTAEFSTIDLIKEYIAGNLQSMGLYRFQKAFSGGYYGRFYTDLFWNHLAHYHYFGITSEIRIRDYPQNDEFQNRYEAIINTYKPDIVIVDGYKLVGHLMKYRDGDVDLIPSPVFSTLHFYSFKIGDVEHIGIPHISSRQYTIRDLNEIFQQIFND